MIPAKPVIYESRRDRHQSLSVPATALMIYPEPHPVVVMRSLDGEVFRATDLPVWVPGCQPGWHGVRKVILPSHASFTTFASSPEFRLLAVAHQLVVALRLPPKALTL